MPHREFATVHIMLMRSFQTRIPALNPEDLILETRPKAPSMKAAGLHESPDLVEVDVHNHRGQVLHVDLRLNHMTARVYVYTYVQAALRTSGRCGYVYAHTHTSICAYMHTYIYRCTHTHTRARGACAGGAIHVFPCRYTWSHLPPRRGTGLNPVQNRAQHFIACQAETRFYTQLQPRNQT